MAVSIGGAGGGAYRGYRRGRRDFGNGVVGGIVVPSIILFISIIFSAVFILSMATGNYSGSAVKYDEAKLKSFAEEKYREEFGASETYESNLLLVFLLESGGEYYYTVGCVGDNIDESIKVKFGDAYSEYGVIVANSMNTDYYTNTVGAHISIAIGLLEDSVQREELDSSFVDGKPADDSIKSHTTNHSTLTVSEDTINKALVRFTESTGIPVVVVMDNMANVFETTVRFEDIGMTLFFVMLGITAVVSIVRTVKSRKEQKKRRLEQNDGSDTPTSESGAGTEAPTGGENTPKKNSTDGGGDDEGGRFYS